MLSLDFDVLFTDNLSTHSATIEGVADTVYGFFGQKELVIGELSGPRPTFTCSTAVGNGVSVGASITVAGEGTFTVSQKDKRDSIETTLFLEP